MSPSSAGAATIRFNCVSKNGDVLAAPALEFLTGPPAPPACRARTYACTRAFGLTYPGPHRRPPCGKGWYISRGYCHRPLVV